MLSQTQVICISMVQSHKDFYGMIILDAKFTFIVRKLKV